jgi:Immunity protein 52
MELQFRRAEASLPSLEAQVQQLRAFCVWVKDESPLFQQWYLRSTSRREDALGQPLLANGELSIQALNVLRERSGRAHDVRSVAVWNGAPNEDSSVALSLRSSQLGRPDQFEFSLRLHPEVSDWRTPARWIGAAVSVWPTALFATFAPLWHSERRIFQDRPGVGWMIYLPRVITAQQVPEARELVPVNAPDGTQRGTIVVSTTEGPYSDDNPAHLAAAHAIETRLVDQDLLPRYADL